MPEELRDLGDGEFVQIAGAYGNSILLPGGGLATAQHLREALRRLEAAGNPDVNCPKCELSDGNIQRFGDHGWFVVCTRCKHEGPCRTTIPEAIKAWKELKKGDPS